MQSRSGEQNEILRRRLLHLLLAGPPVPRAAIAELSEQTAWPLPEYVTLVALRSPRSWSGRTWTTMSSPISAIRSRTY